MWKAIIGLCICCLWVMGVQAQSPAGNGYHLIHLKGGSQIKGTILESSTSDTLRVLISGREEIALPRTIIRNTAYIQPNDLVLENGKLIKATGFYGTLGIGVNIAKASDGNNFKIGGLPGDVSFGYFFKPQLGIGVGASLLVIDRVYMPVYLELRSDLFRRSTSPHLYFKAGYGFDVQTNNDEFSSHSGGWSFQPGLDWRFALVEDLNLLLGFGYQFQYAERNRELWGGRRDRDEILYKRLTFRFSLLF